MMTKSKLMSMVGTDVTVTFKDNTVLSGRLGYTTEFSARHKYRKVGYFTLENLDFKVSHIKKAVPMVSAGISAFLCHR